MVSATADDVAMPHHPSAVARDHPQPGARALCLSSLAIITTAARRVALMTSAASIEGAAPAIAETPRPATPGGRLVFCRHLAQTRRRFSPGAPH